MVTLQQIRNQRREIEQSLIGDRGSSRRQKRDALRDLDRAERSLRRGGSQRSINKLLENIQAKGIYGGRKRVARGLPTAPQKSVIVTDSKGRVTFASRKVLARSPTILGKTPSERQKQFLTRDISSQEAKNIIARGRSAAKGKVQTISSTQQQYLKNKSRQRISIQYTKIVNQKLQENKRIKLEELFLAEFGARQTNLSQNLTQSRYNRIKDIVKFENAVFNEKKLGNLFSQGKRKIWQLVLKPTNYPIVVKISERLNFIEQGGKLTIQQRSQLVKLTKTLLNVVFPVLLFTTPTARRVIKEKLNQFKQSISTKEGLKGIGRTAISPIVGAVHSVKEFVTFPQIVSELLILNAILKRNPKSKFVQRNVAKRLSIVKQKALKFSRDNKKYKKDVANALIIESFLLGGQVFGTAAVSSSKAVKALGYFGKKGLSLFGKAATVTIVGRALINPTPENIGYIVQIGGLKYLPKTIQVVSKIPKIIKSKTMYYDGKIFFYPSQGRFIKITDPKLVRVLIRLYSKINDLSFIPKGKKAQKRQRIPSGKKTSQKGSQKVIEQTFKRTESGKKFVLTKERIITQKKGARQAGNQVKEVKIKRSGLGKVQVERTFKRTESGKLVEVQRGVSFIPKGFSRTQRKSQPAKSGGIYATVRTPNSVQLYTTKGSIVISKASTQLQQFAKLQQKSFLKNLTQSEKVKFNKLKESRNIQSTLKKGQQAIEIPRPQAGVRGQRTGGRERIRQQILDRLRKKSRESRQKQAVEIIRNKPDALTNRELSVLKNIYLKQQQNNIKLKEQNGQSFVTLDQYIALRPSLPKNYIDVSFKVISKTEIKGNLLFDRLISSVTSQFKTSFAKLKLTGKLTQKSVQTLLSKSFATVKTKAVVKLTPKSTYKAILVPVVLNDLVNTLKLTQVTQTKQAQLIKQLLKQKLALKTTLITKTITKQAIKTGKQISTRKTPTKIIKPIVKKRPPTKPTPGRPPRKPPPKKKPPVVPRLKLPKLSWRSKVPKGHSRIVSIIVKQRGKIRRLRVKATENRAYALGKKYVDNKTIRSFQLELVGFAKVKDIKKPSLKKFRDKIGKDPSVLILVEKTKYAIDTPGEKRELRFARKKKKNL